MQELYSIILNSSVRSAAAGSRVCVCVCVCVCRWWGRGEGHRGLEDGLGWGPRGQGKCQAQEARTQRIWG